MKIEVHFHTVLQRQTPTGLQRQTSLELPPGSTLGDLLQSLDIKLEPDTLLMVIGGKVADQDYVLSEGEQVSLIPAMSGGSPCSM